MNSKILKAEPEKKTFEWCLQKNTSLFSFCMIMLRSQPYYIIKQRARFCVFLELIFSLIPAFAGVHRNEKPRNEKFYALIKPWGGSLFARSRLGQSCSLRAHCSERLTLWAPSISSIRRCGDAFTHRDVEWLVCIIYKRVMCNARGAARSARWRELRDYRPPGSCIMHAA